MKVRYGYVSNSSSSSFLITNKSGEHKTLIQFILENPQLVDDFIKEYDWYTAEEINIENMVASAGEYSYKFAPGETKVCTFGDEDGTILGKVYDYILRDGGSSESFTWKFYEFNR